MAALFEMESNRRVRCSVTLALRKPALRAGSPWKERSVHEDRPVGDGAHPARLDDCSLKRCRSAPRKQAPCGMNDASTMTA